MKPVNTRKALRALRHLAREHGLVLTVEKDRGKGDHVALIFKDEVSNTKLLITIDNKSEISPGVQRSTLRYISDVSMKRNYIELARNLAALVKTILELVFGN